MHEPSVQEKEERPSATRAAIHCLLHRCIAFIIVLLGERVLKQRRTVDGDTFNSAAFHGSGVVRLITVP